MYLNLQPAQAIVIGYAYKLPQDATAPSVAPETQRIDFGEDGPSRDLFDFCYYDADLDAVWHATSGERGGGKILLDLHRRFGAGYDVVVWCVTCQSSEFSLSNR